MFLLVAVLNSDAHVRKVLEGFTAIDVGGATVIDSRGMGQMLAADIPIVASIARLLGGSPVQESSKMIFSVISNVEALERAKKIVLGAVGDMIPERRRHHVRGPRHRGIRTDRAGTAASDIP